MLLLLAVEDDERRPLVGLEAASDVVDDVKRLPLLRRPVGTGDVYWEETDGMGYAAVADVEGVRCEVLLELEAPEMGGNRPPVG